jgi:hypothetical protein
LAPLFSPNPHPLPHWSVQGSTLSDQFPYLRSVSFVRFTHRRDGGGSRHLWNTGKLLPDYMAEHPRRQVILRIYVHPNIHRHASDT